MDQEFLPKKPVAKTYKHFTINADVPKQSATRERIEFFYLGKDRDKIDFLINTFEGGYAAESVENAISVLNRIKERNKIPGVLFVDGGMDESAVKNLRLYLASNNMFSSVPFVMDASGLSENQLKRFKNLLLFDDIFFLGDLSGEKLISKINFLKNVKKRPSRDPYKEHNFPLSNTSFDSKFILKRFFDIFFSVLAIFILSPVFLLIALAIKFESPGPVLYVSRRAGRGYKIFNFFKFRTMVLGADEKIEELSHLNHYANEENSPVFFKVLNDSRTTKIGAFLRSTSMDELPQFFNVLMGDMSLVGNRPLPLYEAEKLTTNGWAERFMAPAGITGLWQIKKRRQGEMSMEERINLDIIYSHKYNFMYDLWIMANTPFALFQKSNA